MDEIERLKKDYEEICADYLKKDFWSPFKPEMLYIYQERDFALVNLLKKHSINSLKNKKLLDIGCGGGYGIRRLLSLDASPELIYGIDILEDRIKEARRINPNVNYLVGNAEKLPFENEKFDLIIQYMAFSSVSEDQVKRNMALEMVRVLRDDGLIVWYDLKFDLFKKSKVAREIKKEEIIKLFPNCSFDFNVVILHIAILKRLIKFSRSLCLLLSHFPFLCSHYLASIKKCA